MDPRNPRVLAEARRLAGITPSEGPPSHEHNALVRARSLMESAPTEAPRELTEAKAGSLKDALSVWAGEVVKVIRKRVPRALANNVTMAGAGTGTAYIAGQGVDKSDIEFEWRIHVSTDFTKGRPMVDITWLAKHPMRGTDTNTKVVPYDYDANAIASIAQDWFKQYA